MSRVTDWLFDTKHPVRIALVSLVIGSANIYEATYIDNPKGFMYVISWIFAAAGLLGFVAFLLVAVSEHLSRERERDEGQ